MEVLMCFWILIFVSLLSSVLTHTLLKKQGCLRDGTWIFFFVPRFLRQCNPKLANSTLYRSCLQWVLLLLWSANVCKECVLWLKCKITVFSRCMGWLHMSRVLGDMLHKMPDLCSVPVFHKQCCVAYLILGKTWDFQIESYVRTKYLVVENVVTFGFGVKTIVLSFSWKCLSIFFQQLSGS